jgi:hypothetical protein
VFCLREWTIMIQQSWYFMAWKFTNLTELQCEGAAKKQGAIQTQITHACPQNCWYEGKKLHVCQHSSACSVSLPDSNIFHVQTNYMYLISIIPELHYFQFADKRYSPWYPRTAFQQFCEWHVWCGNFNGCPSVLNHLLNI